MEIRVETGDIAKYEAKAIIVNLFQGVTRRGGGTGSIDRALDGAISQLIDDGEITGKEGELTLIHTLGRLPSPRVLVVGLGKGDKFKLDKVRDLTASALRRLRSIGCETVATITHGAGIAGLEPEACAQAIAEGAIMGLYRFNRHKRPSEDEKEIEKLIIVEFDDRKVEALQRGLERGTILAQAVNYARDMANEPANMLTPTEMAHRADELAKDAGIECFALDREEMETMGMGALLGVAAGSVQPPRMVVMTYRGNPESEKAIGLLGKGVTFDSGGISIKGAQGMEEMKGDMSGGAAVIAATWALAKLGAPVNATAIVPMTENMPSGSATKPGDVLRAMSGKTIEVINTDAEGRLILADALAYARKLGLSPLVDVATLTGAMIVALGKSATGVIGNDKTLVDKVIQAGEATGERMWHMPLFEDYRERLKSDVADIKNTGTRDGGAINAAVFLSEFAEDTPWVHLDMAPTDNVDHDKGAWVKGATGIPVRTLVNLALDLAAASTN